jgi:hypothetical protein
MDTRIKTKDLRQTATFKASPADIYDLLMDSKKHSGSVGLRQK